ncbi:MAG: hypothetical protein NTZ25_02125 [Candidatus Peregrinibacteria bacterium]|nr:hypothetical protein [Candidatus Peregrinibacteria bacterium]
MKKNKSKLSTHKKILGGVLATVLSFTVIASSNVSDLNQKITVDSTDSSMTDSTSRERSGDTTSTDTTRTDSTLRGGGMDLSTRTEMSRKNTINGSGLDSSRRDTSVNEEAIKLRRALELRKEQEMKVRFKTTDQNSTNEQDEDFEDPNISDEQDVDSTDTILPEGDSTNLSDPSMSDPTITTPEDQTTIDQLKLREREMRAQNLKENMAKLKLRERELKAKQFKDQFVDNTTDLNTKLDEMINAKLDSLSTTTDAATMVKIKDAMASLKSDLVTKFTENQDKVSMFSQTAGDAVTKQQTLSAEIIQNLDKIATVSSTSTDVVGKLRTMLTERIWPVRYLSEFKNITDKALSAASEGKDPTEILSKLADRNSSNDKELNRELSSEGLWAFPDVNQDSWYAQSANEAAALGIVQGTENADGFKDLRPEAKLNCAEGIAMMDKAAGLKPDESISADVAALAGNIEWAKPFLQSMANVIGVEKLRSEIDACGGIAGAMKRETFADTAIAVYEKMTGKTVDVNASNEIGQYTDFNQMNEQQRENFAKAHDVGFITGADNGTRANFRGTAIRAEAAKMLIILHKGLVKEGVLKNEFPTPPNGKVNDRAKTDVNALPTPTGN